MAFLIKTDLYTHLYPEILDEIIRKYVTDYATFGDFPETGVSNGKIYKDVAEDKLYVWTGTSYIISIDPDLIVTKGINVAIAEVKSYLSRYDLTVLFGDDLDETITEHLKNITKDVACWQLIRLSNPSIDLKLFRTNYEDAIKWLEKVQRGSVDPEGWPYKSDDPATKGNENSGVQWSSNKKRRQSF
jgi:phage gp36-like protein